MQWTMELLTHWGFNYLNIFLVWKKVTNEYVERTGLGRYSKSVYEFLIIGTKGKVGKLRRQITPNTIVS